MRTGLLIALAATLVAARGAGADPPDPQVDYMLHCRGCHLPDGSGTPGAVPPLEGAVGSFLSVPGGREFLVRVPGSSQSALSDARLAAVLNWILERFDPEALGAEFVPFSEQEVAALRRPPLTDVESVRRELLARIAARRATPRGPGAALRSTP